MLVNTKKEGAPKTLPLRPESHEPYRHNTFFQKASRLGIPDLLREVDSSIQGLSEEIARARLEAIGTNEIDQERLHWPKQLLKAFLNPFILLLTVLAVISYLTDDKSGSVVMGIMVTVSVFLTFFQEYRSGQAAMRLKAMVSTKATVIRMVSSRPFKGEDSSEDKMISIRQEVPIREVVPGDLIHLSAGDMVPADVRLSYSKDLFVSQSSLTGESLPVEKFSASLSEDSSTPVNLPDLHNICFMGTNVISGTAQAVVLKTGRETFLGSVAKTISEGRSQSSFDRGIHRFTWLMLKFMMVMTPMVFLINGFSKGEWLEAFMFAVAVAVGLTPEMLPMIVTVNLARGALSMAKRKVIVKRLPAIQNFGAIDVLCTDKTGTLTQDKVVLEKYVDPLGNPKNHVLKYAFLNSFYQTGLKNLLDVAILKHHEIWGEIAVERDYQKIDEIPFDFARKRMSVILERKDASHVLICKGALEEIFNICRFAEIDGEVIPIESVSRERCMALANDLNNDGMRVIAVAAKEVSQRGPSYSVSDESDLTLLGYVAFLDPPKETAMEAIRLLGKKGVSVKVLTGDNDLVTRKICREVGLEVESLMLGGELSEISDEELDARVEKTTVFAKLSPSQKERIIRSLQRRGHVVGFMGDGINDAPALLASDIGISVDNAVDIAKESADIILLEKSLLVLEEGIIEGRKVFGNIIKYIKMGSSSNFGNVFSILGSSVFLPFLPMQPVQLLTQNLLYDLSQTAIPFDHVDEEYLEKPRKWEIGDIGRFMVVMGPISSIFDYATFAVMWFVFKANSPAASGLFQSGWFIEGLLSQTLIVHIIRTRKIPFLQSRASAPLLLMTTLIMVLGVAIPFSSLGVKVGLVPLPWTYFPWLLALLVPYCLMTQMVKNLFIRRYGFN
ncbi:MAG: magnesium-translocating P-type ATPase [Nitrospiraceae bacterium]|jgi:Mg2+-importing ATPase|nr:magnesium-translocating P-type ATPase [Nitrospiraceae bacterium]